MWNLLKKLTNGIEINRTTSIGFVTILTGLIAIKFDNNLSEGTDLLTRGLEGLGMPGGMAALMVGAGMVYLRAAQAKTDKKIEEVKTKLDTK